MHVSVLCRTELFTAERHGHACPVDHIFPDWNPQDRIGVLLTRPFDAIGASTIIQLGTALFYEANQSRRRDQYPPLFFFHLGGRYGDFSAMDIWPPRREVFLTSDPYALLGAVRDRSITRLLLPEAPPQQPQHHDGWGHLDWVTAAPSGWTDAASFLEQTASAYAYSPTGRVAEPDTTVSTADPECEAMVEDVLEPHRMWGEYATRSDAELLEIGAGPSSAGDLRQWLEILGQRLDEVPTAVREELLQARRASRDDTTRMQTFRRLTAQQSLELLGSLSSTALAGTALNPQATTTYTFHQPA